MRKPRKRSHGFMGNIKASRRNAKLWRMIRAGTLQPMTKDEMRDAAAKGIVAVLKTTITD